MGNLPVPNLCSLMGRRNPIYPLATPTQVGGPHNKCKQTLEILLMMNCNSSWRISVGRSLSESWMHPPRNSPPNTLGKSCAKWGSWCGWPGGHLSKRGRVGSPIATTLTCSHTTRWRVGGQRTTSSPPAPVQPNEDVGCLINTLAIGLQLGTPHINTFSGNAMPGKMEVSFK